MTPGPLDSPISGQQNKTTHTHTVVGPFEEEEEGTGIVSDVVKVKGEDYPRSPALRIDPGTVTIPQYRFNKTKQHTQSTPRLFVLSLFSSLRVKNWNWNWKNQKKN